MKPTSAAIAFLVAGAAAATTLASAGYAYEPSFGAEHLTSVYQPMQGTVDAPGYVSPLLAKEIAVFTNEGIPLARAIEAIEVQSRVGETELSGKLQAAMGSAFAGVWFEASAAKLHVGVTSAAARRTAEGVVARAGLADAVLFTPVRSTSAQLIAAQDRWDRKLAGLFSRGQATTGLRPKHNAVSVTLSPSVPAAQRAALQREAANDDVNVIVTISEHHPDLRPAVKECNAFAGENANCEPSITAGVSIWSKINCREVAHQMGPQFFPTRAACESRKTNGTEGVWEREASTAEKRNPAICSAGPPAIPLANKTERVLLTAGHCLALGGGTNVEWLAFTRGLEEPLIGKSIKFKNGGAAGEKLGDYADIKIEAGGGWQTGNAGKPVLAVTARWNTPGETRYAITKEKLAVEGTANCHSGQTVGEWCGKIFVINEKYESEGKTYEGMASDERMIGEGGDSGGPVFSLNMANEVIMEGTFAAIESMTCEAKAKPEGEFFKTFAECATPKEFREGKEGEWERNQRTYWQPLRQTEGGTVKGSLETLELSLLTTANETIPQFVLAGWLAGGVEVTTELATQTTGEFLLEDNKTLVGKAMILCGAILDGSVNANALGTIKEMLNLAGEAISSTPLTGLALECTAQEGCETGSAPKVWPVGLGWETEVTLMEYTSNYFAILYLPHSGSTKTGLEIECLVLGVVFSDECTGPEGISELSLEGTSLLEKPSVAFTELAEIKLLSCTQGGSESGALEGENTITLNGGGELTASSEGSIS